MSYNEPRLKKKVYTTTVFQHKRDGRVDSYISEVLSFYYYLKKILTNY